MTDFGSLVRSGVEGGVVVLGCSSEKLLAFCSTNGAGLSGLSVASEADLTGVGGAVSASAHGAGTVARVCEGSFAGVERLQVIVVVSLEGLS